MLNPVADLDDNSFQGFCYSGLTFFRVIAHISTFSQQEVIIRNSSSLWSHILCMLGQMLRLHS